MYSEGQHIVIAYPGILGWPEGEALAILEITAMDTNNISSTFLEERENLSRQLLERPYSSFLYIERAWCYEEAGYPDLATGDAYRALLLTDEVTGEYEEYHEQALETFCEDAKMRLDEHLCLDFGSHMSTVDITDKHVSSPQDFANFLRESRPWDHMSGLPYSVFDMQRLTCFALLARLLLQCGCLRDAYIFSERGLEADTPTNKTFIHLRTKLVEKYNASRREGDSVWTEGDPYPSTGFSERSYARRELYPWNSHEPQRSSDENLQVLNNRMKRIAPNCEVRATALPVLSTMDSTVESARASATNTQLGVFATEDIAPHETVLEESSILTANNRLHEPLCDACSAPLPQYSLGGSSPPSCPDCEDIVFCSQNCFEDAMSLYHPAVCGKPDLEAIAKDPSPAAATNALYLLLLGRVYALSETQNIHPLDLPETKFLWGDLSPPASFDYDTSTLTPAPGGSVKKLPFSFEDNILAPLHLLQKMDINIFTSVATADTWIISTLFAKFRGVASARMNPRTGMPEVCAVHPMWCLANHSCAPNVKWGWAGNIKFEARGGEDVIQWGNAEGDRRGGIQKGEQVLNHYCDVGLGRKERREWAVGALGGLCTCERCVWEEAEETRSEE